MSLAVVGRERRVELSLLKRKIISGKEFHLLKCLDCTSDSAENSHST